MLSLITLYIESLKIHKDIYIFNPLEDKDAVSYLFCAFTDEANNTGIIEKVRKKFFNLTHFISWKQVEDKKRNWETFLENNKLNGMANVYPFENNLNLLVYGNLGVLHFRNNEQIKRITGSFRMVQSEQLKIENDDVVMIAFNSDLSSDYDSLYSSERFPMLFVDAIGKKESLIVKFPIFIERLRSIASKTHVSNNIEYEDIVHFTQVETSTETHEKGDIKTDDRFFINDKCVESEVIRGEIPSLFDKLKHYFKKLAYVIKSSGWLWGILCFVIGFFLVLLIMYIFMPENEFLKRLFFN